MITLKFEEHEVDTILKALEVVVRQQGLQAARVVLPLEESITEQLKNTEISPF